jgi:hypothetical protein
MVYVCAHGSAACEIVKTSRIRNELELIELLIKANPSGLGGFRLSDLIVELG